MAKKNILQARHEKFWQKKFFLDPLSIYWDEILKLEMQKPNSSFKFFYKSINDLIDKYMDPKKIPNMK